MSQISSKHILVVDDDDMNREVLEAFLSLEKYEVTLAHNGRNCLEKVNKQEFDLIILDVKMPDISGYDVCLELKRRSITQHIPVMFVSGFDDTEDRQRAWAVGADAYMPRPFEGDKFISLVKSLLTE